MRYIERRAKSPGGATPRRLWDVVDTRKDRVIATGLRMWEAAHKADRLNAFAATGLTATAIAA